MPPRDKGEAVPKDKAAVIARWIKEGAKLDAGLDREGRPRQGTARPLEAAGAAEGRTRSRPSSTPWPSRRTASTSSSAGTTN